MASDTDDFNRADSSSIGTQWVEDDGDFSIVGNTLRQTTTGSVYRKCRFVRTTPATNDNDSEVNGRSSGSSLGFGAFVRGANSGVETEYLYIGFGADAFYLVELTAGGETILDTGSVCTASTTYNARCRANGNAIEGYRNDILDASAVDASLTSGGWGVGVYGMLNGTNDWVDDWVGSDLGAAVASLFPIRQNRIHPAMLAMCIAFCTAIFQEVKQWVESTLSTWLQRLLQSPQTLSKLHLPTTFQF